MLTSFLPNEHASSVSHPGLRRRPVVWRTALLAGCAVSVGVAAWAGHPTGYIEADPALAHLMRGMAVIKALMVSGAAAAVLCRYGWPIAAPVAVAYAAGTAVLAGSTMLIWQLTAIPLAAVLFHAALIGMVCLGWRER